MKFIQSIFACLVVFAACVGRVTADEKRTADIGVKDGCVAAIGENLATGTRDIDASGKLVLPGGIDGVEVARFAREKNRDASILYCTGFAVERFGLATQKGLTDPVLSKPFSIADLKESIGQLLIKETGSVSDV